MRTNPTLVALVMVLPFLVILPAASAVNLSAGITNVAPTIVSITLGGLSSGTLSPTSGTTSSLTATVVAADTNGFNDITGVTVGIIKPDGTTVHVAQAAASFSSGSLLQATYTKTLTMNYYDAAALTTNTYKVKAIATDSGSLTGTNLLSLAVFNYAQLVALNAPASVDVGGSGITPGTSGAITSMSITNYGNQQIDTQISGTDLTDGSSDTITVDNMAYGLASDLSDAAALSGSPTTLSSFNLAAGAASSKTTYLQLSPPTGLPAGTYTGTLTVTAVSG